MRLRLPVTIVASETLWSREELVAEYPGVFTTTTDSRGSIHVFWAGTSRVESSDSELIFHSEYFQSDWSAMNDVFIASGSGRIEYPNATSTSDGWVHLTWQESGLLMYSRALGERAESAASWSEAVALTPIGYSSHDMCSIATTIETGLMIACATISGQDGRLIAISSTDSGETWDEPQLIAHATERLAPAMANLTVCPDESIHVVWTELELPQGWPPTRVMYSGIGPDSARWTRPTPVASANQGWAVMGCNRVALFVVWNGSAPNGGRFARASDDFGVSWQPTIKISEASGLTSGSPSIVADARSRMHVLMFGDRREGEPTSESLYTVLGSNTASAVQVLSAIGDTEISVGGPKLELVDGNTLHAFWRQEARAGQHSDARIGLWHRQAFIADLPGLEGSGGSTPALRAPTATATSIGRKSPEVGMVEGYSVESIQAPFSTVPKRSSLALVFGAVAAVSFVFVFVRLRMKSGR